MEKYKLKKYQEIEKRIFDIIFSLIAIVITSPIMFLVAIAIKLDSKGKVIFKQKRITKYGKEFIIYKFRTMIENAEKETGPILAKQYDDRVTKVGKILRKTRIDEMPQFFNVLKGDMSIVGPRPERREIIDIIIKDVPDYRQREDFKAGITGLAHIKGDYYTESKERLKYDKEYMTNWNLKKDFCIIIDTIKKIIKENIIIRIKNNKMERNNI